LTEAVSEFGTAVAKHRLLRRRPTLGQRLDRVPWMVWLYSGTILAMVLLGVLASQVAPHDPLEVHLKVRLQPPFWSSEGSINYPLGTDHLGRDMLSRIVYGSRISFVVGLGTVLLSGLMGSILGLLSGYLGEHVDEIIMGAADIQLSFPFLLLGILIMALLGPGTRNVILVLALTSWVPFARVVRSQVLSLKEKEFVLAASAIGANTGRIIFRHILPNTVSPITVIATLQLARAIVVEATLSFLGLGVKPPNPSWGVMLADGRQYIGTAWWVAALPGIALLLICLSANALGDWARDVLDPTLRHEQVRG
jgi:peptide/nickel transport system permease protein